MRHAVIAPVFMSVLLGAFEASSAPLSAAVVDGTAHPAVRLIADSDKPGQRGDVNVYYGNQQRKKPKTPSGADQGGEGMDELQAEPEQPKKPKRDNPDGLSDEDMAKRAARHKEEALYESDHISDE